MMEPEDRQIMPQFASERLDGKTVIDQVFADYTRMYALDIPAAAQFWTEPAIAILPSNIIILKTKDDVVAFLSASLERLRSLNYSYTETVRSNLKMLNARTALYGVVMKRIKGDGTILEEAGATYVFREVENDWRICEGIVTDPDRI